MYSGQRHVATKPVFSHGAPRVYSFSNPPVSEEHGSSEAAWGWASYCLYWGLGERPWEHAWDDHCITTDCGHVLSFTSSQGAFVVKNPPTCQCRRVRRLGFDPWVQKIPWRRARRPSPWLENPIDRGAWRATVQGVTKSWTRLEAT